MFVIILAVEASRCARPARPERACIVIHGSLQLSSPKTTRLRHNLVRFTNTCIIYTLIAQGFSADPSRVRLKTCTQVSHLHAHYIMPVFKRDELLTRSLSRAVLASLLRFDSWFDSKY